MGAVRRDVARDVARDGAAMTIRVTCDGDGCGKPIDRDEGGWFGVDWIPLPTPIESDDADLVLFTELVEPGADHEFHFHTADCLLSWVFARSFQPVEGA